MRSEPIFAVVVLLTLLFHSTDSAAWEIEEIIDHTGIGSDCDLVIDSDGGLHISFEYRHGYLGSSAVMYGYKGDDLDTWHLANVDSNPDGYTGYDNEISLDSEEMPRISYVWDIDWEYVPYLKHAWFDGTVWHDHQLTSWQEYVDGPTTICIDGEDYSHIFYGDWYGTGPLRHRWEDLSGWHEEIVATGNCKAPHAVIDGAGRIHLIYYNGNQGAVVYGLNGGDGWVLSTVALDSGVYTASGLDMVLDLDGHPHVVYRGASSRQHHAWFDGSGWLDEVVHDNALGYPSIAIDQEGSIHVCYSVYTGSSNRPLTYSHKSPGGDWTTAEVETDVQCWNTAIDIDPAGRPHIIYYNYSGGITKHAVGMVSTGVPEPEAAEGIRLYSAYPNPAPGEAEIAFELSASTRVELVLYDINGRQVRRLVAGARSRGRHVVQTGDLAGGVYLVRLTSPGVIHTAKLVVLAGKG